VLDPNKLEIIYNSQWFSKMSLADFIRVAGKTTLARIMERDDFSNRFATGSAIGFHELFYPMLQAYDSVMLTCDIELGGTDQTFNLLMGRYLQEQHGQEPQIIMTMPLLEGLDGVQKMSKSLGNYIGLSDSAIDAYGKLMSVSDELMWRYWLLLSGKSAADIEALKSHVQQELLHPLACKKMMAHCIVQRFWSRAGADEGQVSFEALSQQKDYSQARELILEKQFTSPTWIVEILKALGSVQTSSEARRLIDDGAVAVNQEKVIDFKASIALVSGSVIKVGKHRIYKVIIKE
jgi:tyrosyl-tRNA synthetase